MTNSTELNVETLGHIVSAQGGMIAMLLDILMASGHLNEALLRDRMSALCDAHSDHPAALHEIYQMAKALRKKHRPD